jgi:hypothetical protein
VLGERHRWHAVRGYLHELGGDLPAAAAAYADAARWATDVAERDRLVRHAARTRAVKLDDWSPHTTPTNVPRLAAARKVYEPDRQFRFPQSI